MHGYEYLEYLGPYKPRDHPTWWKFTIVELMNDGTLKDGTQ